MTVDETVFQKRKKNRKDQPQQSKMVKITDLLGKKISNSSAPFGKKSSVLEAEVGDSNKPKMMEEIPEEK